MPGQKPILLAGQIFEEEMDAEIDHFRSHK